jgi:mannose-6-phosphate isomerase-like protein (cupin superfamily)
MEEYIFDGELFAIVIRNTFDKKGITFFTEENLSQQLAYMSHPKGKTIQPHIHKPIERTVAYTQEVLIIKDGILKVDFYSEQQAYLESISLKKGDIILLIKGGHGFSVTEDVKMIEVKQGPYAGDKDKIRF